MTEEISSSEKSEGCAGSVLFGPQDFACIRRFCSSLECLEETGLLRGTAKTSVIEGSLADN